MRRLLALTAVLVLPLAAPAADVPVAGRRLTLRASQTTAAQRSARLVARDLAIVAPFPDPTTGAALVISGGAGPGQCRVETTLDPTRWTPLQGNGAQRGWRYRDPTGATLGIRRVVIKPGVLVVGARGSDWPCDLGAAQREPVTAELRLGDGRYCAAFGGAVAHNEAGRFVARLAPAPAGCGDTDVTVANLNILHGVFCAPATASCRLEERIDLLYQWIVASGCPDVVTLQEVSDPAVPLLTARAPTACPFPYTVVYERVNGVDDEFVLSRYPAVSVESVTLYAGFRHAFHARLDHPIGPLDVFSTHLASGSDGAQNPCGGDCPAECVTAGATTVRQCQGVQVAGLVAARHDVATPAVVTGDFNESPSSFVYSHLVGQGWIDTYLAAGNPECNPLTGVGCTAGREDQALTELESPVSNESERIDYVFLVPPGPGALCTAGLDGAADLDGDLAATRIFADDPNPFAPSCGPDPDPICWPSDHEGAELDLNCQ